MTNDTSEWDAVKRRQRQAFQDWLDDKSPKESSPEQLSFNVEVDGNELKGSNYWDEKSWGPMPDSIRDNDFYTTIRYKYSEDKLLEELRLYVNETYSEHYSKNKYQATEFIIDAGHGMSFCLGNVLKYAQRYGHKEGHNRKDLMKVLHYALIALHCHDLEHGYSSSKRR